MAVLVFELSMPSRNSWNGRWSGEERYYAVTRRVTEKQADEVPGSYRYSFGDGWVARVSVQRIEGTKAASIRRKSNGFCGYDWMVDSILRHGDIRA